MRGLRRVILLGLVALMAYVVWNWLNPWPRIEYFTAKPATITVGGSATLDWKTAKATSVEIDHGVSVQPIEGSTVMSPAVTTTYTLTATGSGRSVTKSLTVAVEPLPSRKVAVAARDLFWGTTLTAEMLKLEPETSLPEVYRSKIRGLEGCLPETTAQPGDCYFSDPKSLADRFLLTDLKAHEPILASESTDRGMPAVTRQRAMAVKVDTIVGVAGFVKPGNRVDVLVTLRESPPITKIVLQNILVLATGVTMERKGNEREPSQVNVITLDVSPLDAEKLALASNQGELRLALRNFRDVDRIRTPGATIPSLLASDRLPERSGTGQTAKRRTVEVIKGGQVETKTLD